MYTQENLPHPTEEQILAFAEIEIAIAIENTTKLLDLRQNARWEAIKLIATAIFKENEQENWLAEEFRNAMAYNHLANYTKKQLALYLLYQGIGQLKISKLLKMSPNTVNTLRKDPRKHMANLSPSWAYWSNSFIFDRWQEKRRYFNLTLNMDGEESYNV